MSSCTPALFAPKKVLHCLCSADIIFTWAQRVVLNVIQHSLIGLHHQIIHNRDWSNIEELGTSLLAAEVVDAANSRREKLPIEGGF